MGMSGGWRGIWRRMLGIREDRFDGGGLAWVCVAGMGGGRSYS